MKAATRILTLVGLSLMTGASIGAGPAAAATSAEQGSFRPVAAEAQVRPHDDEVVDYFRTRWACERVGRIGERRDHWEDYDCDRVRRGPNRGLWALEVERGWNWDHDDDDDDDDHWWDNVRV